MKYCPNCNQPCEDTETFCGNCGANLNAAPDPSAAYGAAPRVSTKKEFLNLPENKKVKSEISGAAIICYVCAAITLIVGILNNAFPLILLDVAIVLGTALGIHLAQSRVCSIVLLAYAIFSTVLVLVQTGRLTGYLVIIAGVCAVIYTFKAEKLWKQYQQV